MTPGWRRGGGDDRDNDGGDNGGRDADDSYFCVLRGGCGGAETTVAAAFGMCRTGELTHAHVHAECEATRGPRCWSRHAGFRKVAGCYPLHVEASLGEMLNNKLCPRCMNGCYFLFCFQCVSVSVCANTHMFKTLREVKGDNKSCVGEMTLFPCCSSAW